uniref:Uncharacterized protein n=1 Tax=Caenorhabditis japonica TaxID=281687 RepID=A0A8R1ELE9_CAEJA
MPKRIRTGWDVEWIHIRSHMYPRRGRMETYRILYGSTCSSRRAPGILLTWKAHESVFMLPSDEKSGNFGNFVRGSPDETDEPDETDKPIRPRTNRTNRGCTGRTADGRTDGPDGRKLVQMEALLF